MTPTIYVDLSPSGPGYVVLANDYAQKTLPRFPEGHSGMWFFDKKKDAFEWANELNAKSGNKCSVQDDSRPQKAV